MKQLIIMNLVMLVSGGLAGVFVSSRGYLVNQGYSELYIRAKKNFAWKGGLIQLFCLLAVQAVTVIIIINIKGELISDDVFTIVVPCALLVLIAISVPLSLSFNKELKRLAKETGESIVIDFDYTLLNKSFNIYFELPFTVIVLLLSFLSFRSSGFTTMLYSILIPWMFYIVVRYGRSMNKATYKESYKMMFTFHWIYGVLLTILSLIHTMLLVEESAGWRIYTGVICTVFFGIKMVYTMLRYPVLCSELKKVTD